MFSLLMIYQLGVKMTDTLIKKDDEQGYIVAWKHKQNHNDLGKFDKEMSYGDATKECEKLIAENEEKTFWPEKSLESKEGFRFP
jgi:hypothetical protein|tara:strand:+ start:1065 stop:1316 length:252 start_codon:yes stop_codon:yes gene_type:complete